MIGEKGFDMIKKHYGERFYISGGDSSKRNPQKTSNVIEKKRKKETLEGFYNENI